MPLPHNIWVFFGLIATGKSTVAEAWADRHGVAHFNSDRVRKALAGLQPTAGQQEALDQGIYTGPFSRRTYDQLLARAEGEIRAGRPVVLDASYQSRGERDRVRALASQLGVEVFFILCNCPEDEIMRRLATRRRDHAAVSDGRPEIYQVQKARFEPPDELLKTRLVTLSTDRGIDELLTELDQIFEV